MLSPARLSARQLHATAATAPPLNAIASLAKPTKQGWLLKKSGSGIFSPWRQKYLVLALDTSRSSHNTTHGDTASNGSNSTNDTTTTPDNGVYVLYIYDDRDLSNPPKHEILVDDIYVDADTHVPSLGLRKNAAPFLLYANRRKFYLAAQTRSDRDEWIELLSKTRQNKDDVTDPPPGAHPGRSSRALFETPSTQLTRTRSMTGRHRTETANNTTHHYHGGMAQTISRAFMRTSPIRMFGHSDRGYHHDDDAKSVYSVADSELPDGDNDDAVSMVSGVTHSTTAAHPPATDDDARSFASSGIETLSFCSEPVLTPYELTLMGDPSIATAQQKIGRESPVKRRIPMLHPNSNQKELTQKSWNEKYQQLLSTRIVTLEAALQRDVQLVDLIGHFRETAGEYAKKIVDEYHIQNNDRGTQPLAFNYDGIFFQFACDYDASTAEEIRDAIYRSSRELKGVDAALQAACRAGEGQTPVLRSVLMALVDYKGFRIVAHADIGATEQMIPVHSLHADRPILDDAAFERMAAIGRELNLKQHAVQVDADRRVQVPLAAAVEVHLDNNEKAMYLTGLHELFPIDHFVEDSTSVSAELQQGMRTTALSHSGRLDYGDTHQRINPNHRLRSEFLAAYQTSLCADGHTITSGASRRDIDMNDAEVARASRFLRETWIPAFVRALDNLDARPFDAASLTGEMHRNGINMRYLGMICSLSTIPYVRNLMLIEMIARAAKTAFRDRLRSALQHFRAVGATQIDTQMKTYAATLFSTILGNSDRTRKYFEERLRASIDAKFNYTVTFRQFCGLHRPALFLAMQYHCGVVMDDTVDYDYDQAAPVQPAAFREFVPRFKTLSGLPQVRALPRSPGNSLREDERLAYLLARHFKSIGPKAKLSPSNASATALTQVAAHYNATGRFEEARLYAQAAVSSAMRNHIVWALASTQLLFALAGLHASAMGAPDPMLLSTYRHVLNIAEWHWGPECPLVLALHDRMSSIYQRAKSPERALEYTRTSLDIAERALGKNHVFTAAYQTKTACFLRVLGAVDEAVDRLLQALHIYQSLRADASLVAEVHYYLADSLAERGDVDSAIQHAQTARKLRERMFGFSDLRVIEACRQVATLVLAPYANYRGVLTPQIKAAYREAIACHEKVFRYLKSTMAHGGGGGGGASGGGHGYRTRHSTTGGSGSHGLLLGNSTGRGMSKTQSVASFTSDLDMADSFSTAGGLIGSYGRRDSMVQRETTGFMGDRGATRSVYGGIGNASVMQLSSSSGMSGMESDVKNGALIASMSMLSIAPAGGSSISANSGSHGIHANSSGIRTTALIGTNGSPNPISGPLVTSPFGWSQQLSRSLLHRLTKEIVALKLALIESPRHRECVRMLRAQRASAQEAAANAAVAMSSSSGDNTNMDGSDPFTSGLDPHEARAVILRLAAVSPSVYLDGILQRIDDEDESAVEELRVVLLLTESETVGLATSSSF